MEGRALRTAERGLSEGLGPRHTPQAAAAREWAEEGQQGQGGSSGSAGKWVRCGGQFPGLCRAGGGPGAAGREAGEIGETEQAKTVTPEPRGWEDWGQLTDTDGAHLRNAPCHGGHRCWAGLGTGSSLLGRGALRGLSHRRQWDPRILRGSSEEEAVGEFQCRCLRGAMDSFPAPLSSWRPKRP